MVNSEELNGIFLMPGIIFHSIAQSLPITARLGAQLELMFRGSLAVSSVAVVRAGSGLGTPSVTLLLQKTMQYAGHSL